jgi:fermentation-respiration switch protein FrsA (DUF1100 family)
MKQMGCDPESDQVTDGMKGVISVEQARQAKRLVSHSPGMKRPGSWRGTLLRTLLLLAVFFMLFRWFERSQVYHPTRTVDPRAKELAQPVEDVFFKTSDGLELNAWFFPAPAGSTRRQFVVLLCHGNGGNISHRVDVCEALREAGVNVLSFDYRGYGLSEGRPGEEGTYLDAQAAYAWARRREFEPTRIIAYGESLGGAVASELCRREKTGGLILQSTFTSIPDIGSELYPWLPVRWLSRIRYDTLARLPQVDVPVLVMHSRGDGIIGYKHSERNFAAANEPKLFCELQGDHNDPMTDQKGFRESLEKFLKLVESRETLDFRR